jgi:ABC-type polysaccharide/polyol phosphate transport system ATPase subunit
MKPKTSINIQNVTVEIPVFDSSRSLRNALYKRYMGAVGGEMQRHKTKKRVFVKALNAISFRLNDGDRLGLIGHNGAGKSTLLNVLAGIYLPHSGSVNIIGKVTPLFNPSLGFDQDDTGYENISTIGMFLGLNKKQIEAKRDEIIEFSELGNFIHAPVRTYSTGMLLRLSFAVATSLDPEILLMDEDINAGDAGFAQKASARLTSFYEKVNIIVVASHSDELIKKMCNKAMLLEHGRIIRMSDDVDEVLDLYHERNQQKEEKNKQTGVQNELCTAPCE